MDNILRLEQVTYAEGNSFYLRDYNLDIKSGEILGLLPLNAHGIPTLLELIKNNPPLYYGQVIYDGQVVNSWKDMKRFQNPVTVITSISSLVEGQSVLTNIFLLNHNGPFFIREKDLERKLKVYIDEIGVDIVPRMRVEELTAFERVVVEMMRGVILGHKLIILKDVSSYIGESYLEELYGIIRNYSSKGIAFLFISNYCEEMISLCDRTALMSNGRVLMKLDRELTKKKLRDICDKEYRERSELYKESQAKKSDVKPVMEICGIEGKYFDRTTITVYEGEYSVIHIPSSKTYNEFVDIIFGKDKNISINSVLPYINNPELKSRDVAFVRQRADESMIFPRMSYIDNLLFTSDHKVSSFWGKRGIKKSIRQEFFGLVGEDLFDRSADTLSSKDRMILVYSRVLLQHPKVVFCEMPFNDADFAMELLIRDLQRKLCENGIAVIVLTMNLHESVLEPDRVTIIDERQS